MNYHRTKSGNRSALRVLAVTVLMLVALVLTFTVAASADGPAQSVIEVTADNFTFTGVTLKDGVYTKTYDGTTAVTVAPNSAVALEGVDATDLDKVTLTVESAAFNSKDVVGATHITVRYKLEVADSVKYKYSFGETVLTVPAKIEPAKLTWSVGSANATVTYIPGASQFPIDYNGLDAKPKLSGFIGTEGSGITYSVSPITAANAGTVGLTSKVYATGVSTNYTVTDTAVVNVKVEKVKITITEQNWKDGSSNLDFSKLASAGHSYEYGDALPNINIVTDQYDDVLKLTSAAGYRAGVKGCDIGSYEFKIELLDTQNYEISGKTSVSIHLAAHLITDITLEESMTVVLGSETPSFTIKVNGKDLPEDLLNAITFKKDGQAFNGVIDSDDYGVFEIVAYLPEGNYTFNKTELKTTVTVLRSEKSFDVLDEAGEKVGTVILVNRDGFSDDVNATVTAINGYPDIVKNNKYNLVYKISVSGAAEGATFSLIIPVTDAILAPGNDPLTAESLCIYEAATDTLTTALEAGRGYTVTLADGHYTVDGFTGVGDTTFVVSPNYTVPFFYTVYGIILIIVLVVLLLIAIFYRGLVLRRSLETKQDDPIVIDTVGVLSEHEMPTFEPRPEVDMDAAIEQKVEEVATNVDASLYEEKVEVTDEELQTVVDEAMSDLNDEVALIELESKEDAIVAEIADAIAEEIAEEGATEEATEEVADSEALDEAVAEAVEEVLEEAATEETAEETEEAEVTEEADAADESVLELEEAPAEEVAEEATEEVTEEAAEEATEEVTEEAAEEATEEVTEEVTEEAAEEAVEEATEETAEEVTEEAAEEVTEEVTEEAPVETPVESETENDEDNIDDDNDDDDDGDAEAVEASTTVEDDPFGFGGPVADPATFVDVKENPEAYREMLEREARGEIRIVSRFKKSFQSKLSQSQGNVQDYYSELKNALLSFKGVKSRMSWNYEAFNKGRTHVAKMDAKAKTLYLYLALDPEAYAGTKYGVVNVSHKKKYASTPTLMKIKGDRKFKYALELISVMCGEQMTLPKMEIENVDYRIPRMTIEEMVEAGILKHNAGYIPLVEEAPAETVETVETVEAVEATDVETVINEEVAPVEAVEAVEAVEEAPVEETPVEETEAITADAVEATDVAVDEPAEDAEVVEEAPATETADATEPTEN